MMNVKPGSAYNDQIVAYVQRRHMQSPGTSVTAFEIGCYLVAECGFQSRTIQGSKPQQRFIDHVQQIMKEVCGRETGVIHVSGTQVYHYREP